MRQQINSRNRIALLRLSFPERDRLRSNRWRSTPFYGNLIFLGKPAATPDHVRGRLFLVMLFLVEHDLFGKPASTFPDHALMNYLLKKKPRPLVLRIAEEFLWLVDFHDLSVVHEDDAVGDLPGKTHLVGDNEHGDAVAGELDHGVEHLLHHLRIER